MQIKHINKKRRRVKLNIEGLSKNLKFKKKTSKVSNIKLMAELIFDLKCYF
jgi:hypothetical protein